MRNTFQKHLVSFRTFRSLPKPGSNTKQAFCCWPGRQITHHSVCMLIPIAPIRPALHMQPFTPAFVPLVGVPLPHRHKKGSWLGTERINRQQESSPAIPRTKQPRNCQLKQSPSPTAKPGGTIPRGMRHGLTPMAPEFNCQQGECQ